MINVAARALARTRKAPLALAVSLALGLLFFAVAGGQAQGGTRALINYPELTEGPNSVSLNLYFTMIDGSGQVIQEAQITGGTVTLDDGASYPASVGKPTSTAYIALVLDASGSMFNVMGQMKEAAAQAVESAPDEASFSVIQFNNRIQILRDFTTDKSDVTDAIGRAFSVQNSGTCLYDAAYRAIELLSAAPRGRRAVVLFTDGRDDLGNGQPCSQHTYEELVERATRQEAPVPIHTIGLTTQGMTAADEVRLQELSSSTGGFSQTGGQGSLSLLFNQIISTMSHQWLAQAEIYPSAGENSAQLSVILEDGVRIDSGSVTFEVSQDYVAPPGARVRSVSYSGGGNLILNLTLTRPDDISSFELQLVDVDNNVPSPPFEAEVDDRVEVAASRLEQGTEYRLLIRGLDANGAMMFESRYDFTYDPTIVEGEVRILAVEFDAEAPAFSLNVSSSNLEGLSHYEVWLNDTEDNTVVPGSRRQVEPQERIEIPLEEIPNGTYNIVLSAVGTDGNVLAETVYDDAVYQLGLLTRLGRFVRSSLPFLACLFVLFVGSLGVLFKVVVLDPRRSDRSGVLLESPVAGSSGDDPWSAEAIERSRQRLRGEGGGQSGPSGQPPSPRQVDPAQAKPSPPPPQPSPPPRQPAGAGAGAAAGPEPAAQLPPVELAVEKTPDGNYVGRTYRINTVPFTIGRGGNVLDLAYRGVSRQHASINFAQGKLFLRDEGSTNGTTLNGQPIPARQNVPLSPGDEIGLGKRVVMRIQRIQQ